MDGINRDTIGKMDAIMAKSRSEISLESSNYGFYEFVKFLRNAIQKSVYEYRLTIIRCKIRFWRNFTKQKGCN